MRRQHIRAAFLILAVVSMAGLYVLSTITSAYIAVMGAYAPLAVVVALVVETRWSLGRFRWPSVDEVQLFKAMCVVFLLGVAMISQTDQIVAIGVVNAVLGLLVVGLWLSGGDHRMVMLGAVLLFSLTPLALVLNTGLFFGHGDTLVHLNNIDALLRSGDVDTMPLERYQQTPGLHYLVASGSLVTGLSPYHALVAAGIVAFCTAMVTVGLTGRAIFSSAMGVPAMLGAISIAPATFYAVYFFPQSMALCLLIGLLFLAFRMSYHGHALYLLAGGIFAAAAILTHSLTVYVFGVIFVLLYIVSSVLAVRMGVRTPDAGLTLIPLVGAVSYWVFVHERFIRAVTRATIYVGGSLLLSPLYIEGSDASVVTSKIGLGMAYPTPGIDAALEWFTTPQSVYYTAFAGLSIVGLMKLFGGGKREHVGAGVVLTALIGVALFLKTPIPFNSKIRLALLFIPLVGVLIGLGISVIRELPTGVVSTRTVGCLALVGLLASAPLVGAFAVERTGYSTADAYTDAEIAQLRSMATFADSHEGTVAAVGTDQVFLDSHGVQTAGIEVSKRGVRTEAPFLLRETMWKYKQTYSGPTSLTQGAFIMSEAWQHDTVMANNRVYAAGDVTAVSPSKNQTLSPHTQPHRQIPTPIGI